MANPANFGKFTGRLAQDIVERSNRDGSKTLLIKLAVEDNFTSGEDNKAKTQYPELRAFIPSSVKGRGSWDRVGKGDLIEVMYSVQAGSYEKDGETVYTGNVLQIDGYPNFLEPKSVTEARAARNALTEGDAAAPAAEPAAGMDPKDAEIARLRAQLAADNGAAGDPFQG